MQYIANYHQNEKQHQCLKYLSLFPKVLQNKRYRNKVYPLNVVRNTSPSGTFKTHEELTVQTHKKLELDEPQSYQGLDLFYGLELLFLDVSLDQVLLHLLFTLINLDGFTVSTFHQMYPPFSIFGPGRSLLNLVSLIYLISFLDGVLTLKYVSPMS